MRTESERAAIVQSLINKELNAAKGITYAEAWSIVMSDPKNAELAAEMKRAPMNLPGQGAKKIVQLGRVPANANATPGTGNTVMNSGGLKGKDAYPEGFAGGPQVNAMRAAARTP